MMKQKERLKNNMDKLAEYQNSKISDKQHKQDLNKIAEITKELKKGGFK